MSKRKKSIGIILIALIALVMVVAVQPVQSARIILTSPNDFSPSGTTYENKTMHFQVADPYDGYAHWSYELGGTVQGPSDNKYYMDTAISGYAEYFGFDEFTDHKPIMAEVTFRTTLIAGTYHFQPLAYFYQKTALESNTHWALAIDWDSSGIDLIHNTGNGNSPSTTNLVATAPTVGVDYKCRLSSFAEQTFVSIQDISSYPTYPVIYAGYVTTPTYDASALYAGFGQYSSGNGHIYGVHDDFTISDVILSYPDNGIGFNMIGAYIDEVYTHTFFDIDEGENSSLEVDITVTNITLLVECWLNSTTYGVSTTAEGLNIIRHNVTVTGINGTVVFSQSNFTYLSSFDYGDDLFWYQYSVELDFILQYAEIYTVIITYEVFYI